MKFAEDNLLKVYSDYFGDHVDNINQLVKHTFDGKELLDFINHIIKEVSNNQCDHVYIFHKQEHNRKLNNNRLLFYFDKVYYCQKCTKVRVNKTIVLARLKRTGGVFLLERTDTI